MTVKAPANQSCGPLRVICPHCRQVNVFEDWSEMYIFVCEHCGEPVEVDEPFR